jgi:hypothetical protein
MQRRFKHSTSSSKAHLWVHSKEIHHNLPAHKLPSPKLILQYKDPATWAQIYRTLENYDLTRKEELDHLQKKHVSFHAFHIGI